MADSQSPLLPLIQQLQQELQNQRLEIHALRTDVRRLQSQPSSPRSRLPDPPKFDGKPYTLRTWLPSIRAKLRAEGYLEPGCEAYAFDYVWDRLEQPQQASVLHLRQSAEASQSWDYEALFSYFQRLCYNPREHQESVQRLTTVRQRDEESLVAYLARFERLTYEADALSWPDVTRVTMLHRGLRPALRQSLEESEDSLFSLAYNDYIELVQRFDRRSRRPQPQVAQPSIQKPLSRTNPPVSEIPKPEPMDINAIQLSQVKIISPPPSPTSRSASSTSCPSSANRRAYRLKHDLCFCCGSNNHWISTCPRSHSPASRSRPRTSSPSPKHSCPMPSTKSQVLDCLHKFDDDNSVFDGMAEVLDFQDSDG